MDRNTFINQVAKRLKVINVPFKIGDGTDITISATFKKQQDDNDDKTIIQYSALLFLNQEKNTIFAFEKAIMGEEEISKSSNYGQTVVKITDDDEDITIGSIFESIGSIAIAMGFSFEKTDDEKIASYSTENIPIAEAIAYDHNSLEDPMSFCVNCGAKMKEGARFCPSCGADSQQEVSAKPKTQDTDDASPDFTGENPSFQQPHETSEVRLNKPKSPFLTVVLIAILTIGALVVVAIILGNNLKGKKVDSTLDQSASVSSVSTKPSDSAIVSAGVQLLDLGNILNGQYYFATDEYVFYSSFDINDKAHIYSVKKDGTEHKAIFDGFGWSLVVIEDWLYFSGNQGAAIDGSYNIFRMKFDGSQLERINDQYSYGMFLYGDYLYYMKKNSNNQDSLSICRSSIDGKNEEVLFPNGKSPLVHNNKLYYFDNQGNMYRTDPDGKNPKVLLTATVKFYVLSGEKIIYNDFDNNIYICDLDGGNNKLIRSSKGTMIYCVNVYDGRIFFSEYDTNFNYSAYGYNYTIKSCKLDGSDEKSVFSSVSYGIYMNLVNNKLMLMDYTLNSSSNIMNAAIKVMDLDGSNATMLTR